jgi:hypothetical protein
MKLLDFYKLDAWSSIPGRGKKCLYLGSMILTAVVMKSSIFWDVTASSPLKVNRRFEGIPRLQADLATFFTPVSSLAYFPTLKMEATYSS